MTTPLTVGMRLKLGPMSGLATDPYWLTVTAVAKDGEIATADEDGMVDSVPAAIWHAEYEPRILEVEEPALNPDEPPMDEVEEPEEIPFGDEPEPEVETSVTCPSSRSIDYSPTDAHDPTDREATPLERLADMVNRQYNCRSMARKFQQEADVLAGQIEDFLLKIARKAIVDAPAPDPLTTALEQAIEERAPQVEPSAVQDIPTAQAQAIAEGVAAQVMDKAASDEYETVARLEMNRSLAEVRGISSSQAARMAEKGIKTLANFSQAVEERPADWWSGMLYINKAKGDLIEDAVADHFSRFRKKYGRE